MHSWGAINDACNQAIADEDDGRDWRYSCNERPAGIKPPQESIPPARRITNADLEKCVGTWRQRPDLVSQGERKNSPACRTSSTAIGRCRLTKASAIAAWFACPTRHYEKRICASQNMIYLAMDSTLLHWIFFR